MTIAANHSQLQLTVDLASLADTPEWASHFYSLLQYNEATARWEPVDFVTYGAMVFPALGEDRIQVRGIVSSQEAETLNVAINNFWDARLGAEPIRITGIQSSRRPALSCRYDRLEPFPQTLYEVTVTNSSLPTINDLNPSGERRIVAPSVGLYAQGFRTHAVHS